jgi:lysophospholipase L1-like esterase
MSPARSIASRLRHACAASTLTLLIACSGTDGDSNSTGGKSAGSGGANSGGSVAQGGSNALGGSQGNGGSAMSGGAPSFGGASGGASQAGAGASSQGGVSTAGGAPGPGGSAQGGSAQGGSNANGGATSGGSANGGTTANGGSGGASSGGAAGNINTGGSATGGSGGASASYNPCPTNGDPCKILPLGDSITYGLITIAADKPNGKDSNGGYRREFFAKASAANQKITFTGSQQNGPDSVNGVTFPKNHEGHSGFTIDDSTGNGINDKSVLDPGFKTTPHIVLLHIGTNDVYSPKGMQAGMADRLGKLLDELSTRAPNALIVVAKIVPLSSSNSALTNYNNAVPGVVSAKAAQGKHVILVDPFTGFKSNMLSADGVHPNQSGYDYLGDTFYAGVSSYLPK